MYFNLDSAAQLGIQFVPKGMVSKGDKQGIEVREGFAEGGCELGDRLKTEVKLISLMMKLKKY